LLIKQVPAGPPMMPTAPVSPEKRFRTYKQWMQQHTYLVWLLRSTTLPLTLLTQRTGATTAPAGGIHDTQAAIGFSASLMRDQRLVSGATQRVIGL
jgi:hypothetical protein